MSKPPYVFFRWISNPLGEYDEWTGEEQYDTFREILGDTIEDYLYTVLGPEIYNIETTEPEDSGAISVAYTDIYGTWDETNLVVEWYEVLTVEDIPAIDYTEPDYEPVQEVETTFNHVEPEEWIIPGELPPVPDMPEPAPGDEGDPIPVDPVDPEQPDITGPEVPGDDPVTDPVIPDDEDYVQYWDNSGEHFGEEVIPYEELPIPPDMSEPLPEDVDLSAEPWPVTDMASADYYPQDGSILVYDMATANIFNTIGITNGTSLPKPLNSKLATIDTNSIEILGYNNEYSIFVIDLDNLQLPRGTYLRVEVGVEWSEVGMKAYRYNMVETTPNPADGLYPLTVQAMYYRGGVVGTDNIYAIMDNNAIKTNTQYNFPYTFMIDPTNESSEFNSEVKGEYVNDYPGYFGVVKTPDHIDYSDVTTKIGIRAGTKQVKLTGLKVYINYEEPPEA